MIKLTRQQVNRVLGAGDLFDVYQLTTYVKVCDYRQGHNVVINFKKRFVFNLLLLLFSSPPIHFTINVMFSQFLLPCILLLLSFLISSSPFIHRCSSSACILLLTPSPLDFPLIYTQFLLSPNLLLFSNVLFLSSVLICFFYPSLPKRLIIYHALNIISSHPFYAERYLLLLHQRMLPGV